MKSLSTKKIYVYLIYQNLKRTPPREYPDTNEMVVTVDEILPALESVSAEFITFSKRADDINNDLAADKTTQEEARTKIEELQKEVRAFESSAEATGFVTIELNSSAFGILSAQFERWGKGNSEKQIPGWFNKLEDFVNFSKDIKKVS
jgi:hypothetical protein